MDQAAATTPMGPKQARISKFLLNPGSQHRNIRNISVYCIIRHRKRSSVEQKPGDMSCLFLIGPINTGRRPSASRNARCALCINKLGLVQLPGEFSSRIQDEIRSDLIGTDDSDPSYLTASVYEDGVYQLHVELDCDVQTARDSLGSPCSKSLSVFGWIDYNDNEFDDSEGALLRRSWSDSDAPTGAYDLTIRVPSIDGRTIKAGPHRLRLSVMPSAEYIRECGSFSYLETKDYTVNVVRRAREIGKSLSVS
jgi:hypothetical protein